MLFLLVLSCDQVVKNGVPPTALNSRTENAKVVLLPQINKAFVLGKFDYKSDSTFIKLDPTYTTKTIFLKKEVYRAFLEMHTAASLDGIDLKIVSGTRNFKEQKRIWERKWDTYADLEPKKRALKILEYSAMPSSSRHHWGTDVDLNSLNNSYFNSGKGLELYNWLQQHANRFGFYQVYTDKSNGRTGYNMEKWHWSYLPLAKTYLDFYNSNIKPEDIAGFKGSELAGDLNSIGNYVNGVSEKTKRYKQD